FSAVPNNVAPINNIKQDSKVETKPALTFIAPGKLNPDGTRQAAVIYYIPQVNPKDYFQGQIHLKTKSLNSLQKDAKSFNTASIMEILNKCNIQNIRSLGQNNPGNSINSVLTNEESPEAEISRIYEIHYSANIDPYELCSEFMNNPDVEYATPIFKRYNYDYTPNDPSISNQWAINTIQLKKAWDITKGDKTVKIGIVDSGVFWTHEDLQDNIWINPGETGLDAQGRDKRTNGIDDDGDGYIDDWHGWDLIGDITNSQLANGQWQEDNNPSNINGFHGTHVAGLASAVTDNNKGIAGTGFNCTILPVKCAPDNGGMGVYRGYDGIKYAADMGADIINCSWGGPGSSPAEQDMINYAVNKGTVVVVAAGNDNGQNVDDGYDFPAGYDNVLSVGATGSNDKIASFSNLGIKVTVYSPGAGIYSTLPQNQYANLDGTSMASPIVAGVAALVKSVHKDWTPKQIIHQIRSTSDNVVNSNAGQRPYYYGRVNAYKAVNFNNNSGSSVPGLEVTSVNFKTGSSITDTNQTPITIKVKNYLSNASNVTMNIISMDNAITVTPQSSNIGNISMMQEIPVNITMQVSSNNPWYSGTSNLLVTFTSGAYTDYQLIKIPILITSKNNYKSVLNMPGNATQWLGASSPNENVLWTVGYGGAFNNGSNFFGGYLRTTTGGSFNKNTYLSNDMCSNVFAFDENTAYVVTGKSNGTSSTVFKTTDAGTNWSNTSIPFTGFINDINFYDNKTGLILGDPKGTVWGIGISTDGGQSWNPVTDFPAAISGETGLNTSCAFNGSNAWFGTTTGRVFRSTNMGNHWTQSFISGASYVSSVSFLDSLNGVAIYRESTNGPSLVASSVDGGNNWIANKYNFNNNNLNPVFLYSAPGSGYIYVLCTMGQIYGTSDNGATWMPEMTKSNTGITMGAGYTDSTQSKVRIWNVGDNVGFLDFYYATAVVKKELKLLTGTDIVFDSIAINTIQLKTATIENSGNIDINVNASILPGTGTNSNDFKFFGSTPTTIIPTQQPNIKVKFGPTTVGKKTATLVITNDANLPEIDVNLSGYATGPVSVQDAANSENYTLNQNVPNPSSDFTTISFFSANQENFELSIVNSLGMVVMNIAGGIASSGWNSYNISLSDIPQGMYFIRLKTGNAVLNKKMIIIK
ncbi:MAG: S8 family serine peptidase, partial [FCB group bacterium]